MQTARIGDRSWRERASDINQALVREWLEEREFTTVIATDGSIREKVTAWGGAVWRNNRICYEWSTAREGTSCSYRSECEAFEDALVWISANVVAEEKVVILTDSLSLVTRLEKGLVKRLWGEILAGLSCIVTVTYIPGHCGISFNERADRLAGKAEPFEELIRTPDDVLAELRSRHAQSIQEKEGIAWSVERLLERGWHLGDGRDIRLRGLDRVTHNQIELGVLSSGTLRRLLEGGGPERQPVPLLLCG